jgi:hypothetical protein
MYTREQLILKGYIAVTKRDEKSFELPPFCLHSDYKHLPLHMQVRFTSRPEGIIGYDELVHPLKNVERYVPKYEYCAPHPAPAVTDFQDIYA